ncbi:hypothetical protein JHK84_031895 [Glycine max]|nr:hypothetical protein JHK86_031752 [Glycine max]KAG5146352.1 hypothetical protein JHK84_031895 [Glycine max]
MEANIVMETRLSSRFKDTKHGETEEEFSTRLGNNLEQLILKEGLKPRNRLTILTLPIVEKWGRIYGIA